MEPAAPRLRDLLKEHEWHELEANGEVYAVTCRTCGAICKEGRRKNHEKGCEYAMLITATMSMGEDFDAYLDHFP